MANITLTTRGYKLCPEGEHIFRIWRVDYDKEFGKVVIYLINAKGITHIERFNLMLNETEMNPKACEAFSFFARTALNDSKRDEIDHTELINRYIGLEIVHNTSPNKADPTQTSTFANSTRRWVATGFDTEPVPKALSLGNDTPKQEEAPKQEAAPVEKPATSGLDLNSLLN